MLIPFLIILIWFSGFIFSVAREDKLKITKVSYPASNGIGIHLTGKARDSRTDYVWRNLWLHLPRKSFYFKFRVTKWKGYAKRDDSSR